jgi:hypothetical protein
MPAFDDALFIAKAVRANGTIDSRRYPAEIRRRTHSGPVPQFRFSRFRVGTVLFYSIVDL